MNWKEEKRERKKRRKSRRYLSKVEELNAKLHRMGSLIKVLLVVILVCILAIKAGHANETIARICTLSEIVCLILGIKYFSCDVIERQEINNLYG